MPHAKQLLEALIDASTLKILRLFINNDDQKYYLREVAKLTKVPPASTFRIINRLVGIGILGVEHIKRFKLYYINIDESRFLLDVLQDRKSAVTEFVNLIKGFDGVQMVVLHGNEDKSKANVLVIGTDMDVDSIKRNSTFLSEKYKFNLILLTLTPDQYNQMSSMGLYPGKKKILFDSERMN